MKTTTAKNLLSRARELVDRRNLLIIDSPDGASKLDEALRRLHEGITVKVIDRKRIDGRVIRLKLKASLFKAALRGQRLNVSAMRNGQVNPADRVLDKAGTVTLDVTDVRGMKPVRLALTVGKHESLRKEITLKPELMHLPVELQLTVKGRRLNRELPAAIRRTILEKFKHVVGCRRTHRRCFRLKLR